MTSRFMEPTRRGRPRATQSLLFLLALNGILGGAGCKARAEAAPASGAAGGRIPGTSSDVRVASDFFVITSTSTSQTAAQGKAFDIGGWVLPTDFYPALQPHLFAVVRGPYRTSAAATAQLRWLQKGGHYKDAYVKEAGRPLLPDGIVNGMVPYTVLLELLGELSVTVSERKGGDNGCEPEEPYYDVDVTRMSAEPVINDATGATDARPKRLDLGLGGFWVSKATGAIQRMLICTE